MMHIPMHEKLHLVQTQDFKKRYILNLDFK